MSTTDSTAAVPHLIKDAIVNISIGTQCISHIQLAVSQLMSSHNIEGLGDRISAGTVSEPYEVAIVGLSNLLASIYQIAQDSNQIVFKSLDLGGLQ